MKAVARSGYGAQSIAHLWRDVSAATICIIRYLYSQKKKFCYTVVLRVNALAATKNFLNTSKIIFKIFELHLK